MAAEVENSKWVSSMMKRFCKLVGFSIVKHEAQCVALFCPGTRFVLML